MFPEDQLGPNRASVPQINRLGGLFFCTHYHYKYEEGHNYRYMIQELCSIFCRFYLSCADARGLIWAGSSFQAPPLVFASCNVYRSTVGPVRDPSLYKPQPIERILHISGTGLLSRRLSYLSDRLLSVGRTMVFVKSQHLYDFYLRTH